MDTSILLLRSMLESCRARLATLGEDMQSPLMEQAVLVLQVTSKELPPGYTITHDVASGRYFPRKNAQLIRQEGEPLWYTDETNARIYCWEQASPGKVTHCPL